MNFTKNISLFLTLLSIFFVKAADPFISFTKTENSVVLKERNSGLMLFSDSDSDKGILRAVTNLQSDFQKVTGVQPTLISQSSGASGMLIIIGEAGKSKTIDALIKAKKIDGNSIKGKNEKYIIQNISNPFPGVSEAIVIAGSDKRGTIYGIYEMSQQIGVSPWYYWADVPVEKKENLYFKKGIYTDGEPAVEYRGIFLNDEEPSLGSWARATFGGINSKFYEKVFELILRMKGNYIWPAMWGKAFYDDDVLNGPLANEMGIIMGTSHHEPMAQAQTDWHRYIKKNNLPNVWDYSKNEKVLQEFWKLGLERSKNWEKLVTVGMRGDGDEAMGEGTNISLLEKIVKDQRKIITDVTGKKAEKTPQVWALYKEVQYYYDKGMRVPDDVILLFCDDNWGNVRKLPDLSKPLHKGGYGMYYHFDYVGGPRNSKWINISPIQRVWEQMNLSYEHKVDKVWVVNVGDLKPMEFPISFFLEMAWNPKQFNSKNLLKYTEKWSAQQFGEKYAKEIARMINLYSKYNRRVTPETLCSNLYEMYYAVAKNKELAAKKDIEANVYADKVKECFDRNAYLDNQYNNVIAGGKWQHMMDQMKIGYKAWFDGKENIMPEVTRVSESEVLKEKVFQEKDGYVSIEAENFARMKNSDRIHWEVIPDFGKTKSGVTTFPQNVYPKSDENLYLEYDINFESKGEFEVQLLLAPTLNFNHNKGLRYEISFDGETPQIVNFNGHYRGELGRWQSEHIIKSITKHQISQPGKHTLRFRVLEPGIVLEKILINTGGLQPSYLGAPESEISGK
ncbi:glycosyl hydrolase 115 family protein [Epilithonimonas pallida]|uniref:Glycosyl hydrolase family 67 N-terminus n=1 Tax=Epilithonimonas pallida TaxID=373671 RepID=A0ABY1QXD2_9FLAO|nr:glycosyl hydrolase 115 family protein [Epilithonimonas pallida]SMP86938.1 Glycosyl hydrolase family 67 N-terminus [Epilithonimonas pallida]